MPSRLGIYKNPDDVWYAQVENTNVNYEFVNGSRSVEQLCDAMRVGAYSDMPVLFVETPPAELIEQQLFQDCDSAEVIVDIVWSGVDTGEVIAQALSEVADAIFLALG